MEQNGNETKNPGKYNEQTDSGQNQPTDKNKQGWKYLVFIIVLILAGTLAAHALLKSGQNGSSCGLCPGKYVCSPNIEKTTDDASVQSGRGLRQRKECSQTYTKNCPNEPKKSYSCPLKQ